MMLKNVVHALKVPLRLLWQSFLRHLLQEAAVEPGEGADRKKHLERHRRVLQTHG